MSIYSLMDKRMGPRQVSGLGDDAYVSSWPFMKSVRMTLSIKKGTATISVSGLYSDFQTREELFRYIGERLVAGM
jgi:hypothetical protein